MSNLLYFAYGSNMHPNWLRNRITTARVLSTSYLRQWKLFFHKRGNDGSAKCNIVNTGRPEDVVYGVIYQIHKKDKQQLDMFESGYRTDINRIGNNDKIFKYLAEDKNIADQLSPYSWYKDIVIAGARYHQLPEVYINQIISIPAVKDPDIDREANQRQVILY